MRNFPGGPPPNSPMPPDPLHSGSVQPGHLMKGASLEQVEEELARVERSLAASQDAARRSHAESARDAAVLRDMGLRAKAIMNRPKSWRGGAKRSDTDELEALKAEIKAKSELADRAAEAMRALSAEARELTKRHQALSSRRAEILSAERR